jgi:hypothetical protein
MTATDMDTNLKPVDDTTAISTENTTDHLVQPEAANDNRNRLSYTSNVTPPSDKDQYLVKTIDWKNQKVRIITQNGKDSFFACISIVFIKLTDTILENGPCPLVAICNVLFLRGDLEIQPSDREMVTFEYLVDRLGDYLLNHAPTDDDPVAAVVSNSDLCALF